ncbi:hypothetical protein Syun_030924 [Stephania yunnanensis]|uniref:DNA topoisomerase (ATP-hydrolyzing) n=1 Tax=Stephania yunnanensis TaxID=152371 RepID=A0AAP0HES3_9MAGN
METIVTMLGCTLLFTISLNKFKAVTACSLCAQADIIEFHITTSLTESSLKTEQAKSRRPQSDEIVAWVASTLISGLARVQVLNSYNFLAATNFFNASLIPILSLIGDGIEHSTPTLIMEKPLHDTVGFSKAIDGITIDVALQWCSDAYSDTILGYANSIRTVDGGTHIDGVKASLTRTLNNLGKKSKIIKTRLGNPEVRRVVDASVQEYLTEYLELHPDVLDSILSKALNALKGVFTLFETSCVHHITAIHDLPL